VVQVERGGEAAAGRPAADDVHEGVLLERRRVPELRGEVVLHEGTNPVRAAARGHLHQLPEALADDARRELGGVAVSALGGGLRHPREQE